MTDRHNPLIASGAVWFQDGVMYFDSKIWAQLRGITEAEANAEIKRILERRFPGIVIAEVEVAGRA